jgi:hypothetical protein
MQIETLRWLVLAVGIPTFAGCERIQPPAIKASPVPLAQPFVFYDEAGEPSGETTPLSEVELREIIDWVAAQTPDRVWLIRVRPSPEKGIRNNVVAYLAPDVTTSRIRVGRAYNIPTSREQTGIRSPWKYAQISMPDHNFTEELTKPPATEMPFGWPMVVDPNSKKTSPMPNEEVVAISDFLRRVASDMPIKSTLPDQMMARDSLKLPIFKITDMGEKIGVVFGYMHEDLWGGGVNVMVKRTRDGYKALDWSYWVS